MESSSDSEPMDFQQLSNFIKEAYEKNPNYKEMERSPSAKEDKWIILRLYFLNMVVHWIVARNENKVICF